MKEKLEHADAAVSRHAETVKHIRQLLGRTQGELASALGISSKAIQSYEQGWRVVPARVLIQLLLLVALNRRQSAGSVPCWEVRRCDPAQRSRCASYTLGHGQLCWFIGDKNCKPEEGVAEDDIIPCMKCPVVKRLLAGTAQGSSQKPEKPAKRGARKGTRRAAPARGPSRGGKVWV